MVLPDRYSTCCDLWLDPAAIVDRPASRAPWDVWNSPEFRRLRAAVLDGMFAFCQACPKCRYAELADVRTEAHQEVMGTGPAVIGWGNDVACNLACPSCRAGPRRNLDERLQREVFASCMAEWQGSLRSVNFANQGDPFASAIYRDWLLGPAASSTARVTIGLRTNGLLLPAMWPKIPETARWKIREVFQSVDAATGPTYELLRRPGRWTDLLKSLDFIGALRRSGPVGLWQWNFVVQPANFREAPDFVRMAKACGADRVWFLLLIRTHHAAEAFAEQDLARPDHPDRAEFLRVFADPILSDPIVVPMSLAETKRKAGIP
jgi:MoaA/NifB/PqqE/SkfB family radical SAM enzyme